MTKPSSWGDKQHQEAPLIDSFQQFYERVLKAEQNAERFFAAPSSSPRITQNLVISSLNLVKWASG